MLSGNMFELVAYGVAYCVSCFITMLWHLAFSSNILDDWYAALVNVIDLFCDLGDCDLGDLGDLGTVDLYGTVRQLGFFIWVSADLWPVVRTWVYFSVFATRVISMFGRGTLRIINSWFGNSLCWVFIVNVRHIFILDRTILTRPSAFKTWFSAGIILHVVLASVYYVILSHVVTISSCACMYFVSLISMLDPSTCNEPATITRIIIIS